MYIVVSKTKPIEVLMAAWSMAKMQRRESMLNYPELLTEFHKRLKLTQNITIPIKVRPIRTPISVFDYPTLFSFFFFF